MILSRKDRGDIGEKVLRLKRPLKLLATEISTPLGPMMAVTIGDHLCQLEFLGPEGCQSPLSDLEMVFHTTVRRGWSPTAKALNTQLKEYFSRMRTQFDLPLFLVGTDFQKLSWQVLLTIPYGETMSYGEQARQIEKPKAVRAVGGANGRNRISIVVPCHRVIGGNGKLTGFAAGLARKKALLELESSEAQMSFLCS